MEIVSDRQTRLPEGAVGMSFPFSREGVQVIIASDRIEQLRTPVYMIDAIIMGCVMAHEIAHVLLRSETHSTAGIMRAKWDRSSYQLAGTHLFAFTKADAAALREAAQHRQELACGTLYSKYPDE